MAKRRRRRRQRRSGRAIVLLLLSPFLLYLAAALLGSLVPVNRSWEEPDQGVTVYLANNGLHADIIMPARALGLDWEPLVPKRDFASPDPRSQWVAFGSGEERVYLETPRWRDIRPRTLWSALTGGNRVMHVEWVASPAYADRAIRLRPEEYRRLWAAVRSDFEMSHDGKPVRIDHPGYRGSDAFYRATGRAHALRTCNNWAAGRLRLAGVKASLWPPFIQGLVWRYRPVG